MRLIVENLQFQRQYEEVFSPLSFRLSSGEGALISGKNGAGKTTLLRLLCALSLPMGGHIRYEDDNGEEMGADLWRRYCHFIGHRDSFKASLTVFENLSFWGSLLGDGEKGGRIGVQEDHIMDVADFFSLSPNKLAAYLSAGQKRRLSLARLVLIDRPIWLLDEPFGVLDMAWSAHLNVLIEEHIYGGGCVILASHIQPRCSFDYHITLPSGDVLAKTDFARAGVQ